MISFQETYEETKQEDHSKNKNNEEKSHCSERCRSSSSFKEETQGGIKNGKWTDEEHRNFVKACLKHGNNWSKVKDN
jgi:hypothetical protein